MAQSKNVKSVGDSSFDQEVLASDVPVLVDFGARWCGPCKTLDKVIDRWEYFEDGVLVRIGYSRFKPGVPDHWDVVAPDGSLLRRDYDDDGDGKVDRSEPAK